MKTRFLVGLLLLAGAVPATSPALADGFRDPHDFVLSVDVAEDFTKFVFTPLSPGAPPERGATFITEGSLFPAGTIPDDPTDFDPAKSGSTGKWICGGTHLVAASEIPAAPVWVMTDQLYQLPGQERMLTTSGTEGGTVSVRAVTGGTGVFKGWVGEQRQRFLGFNKTGGVTLRVTFRLRRATP